MKKSQLKLIISEIIKQAKLLENGLSRNCTANDITWKGKKGYQCLNCGAWAEHSWDIKHKKQNPLEKPKFFENDLNEAISPKSVATIEKWRKEVGDRQTGVKLIDTVLERRLGLLSADLADTAIFANGLDAIEEVLKENNYEAAIRQAIETAREMIEDEGGAGIWEEYRKLQEAQGWAGADDRWISHPITKKEPKYYKEYGVTYCHIDLKKEKCPPGMKIFPYTEEHVPTKKKFPRQICCYNENDFRKLLGHWNTAVWKYEPTSSMLQEKVNRSELKFIIKEIVREIYSEQFRQDEISNKWKALASAALVGYAGLHTPFGTKTAQHWSQTPAGQQIVMTARQMWNQVPPAQRTAEKAKQIWGQIIKPGHIDMPNPNEPLPSEKGMSPWDLAGKYTARNVDLTQKLQPFVKRYLPPVSSKNPS